MNRPRSPAYQQQYQQRGRSPGYQPYNRDMRARSRPLSQEGRPFQYRYNQPTNSDISWILRTMDRNNYHYWQSKECDKCNAKGHGSVICPDYTCPKCHQIGIHLTVDHCALVKNKLATVLLTTKRADRLPRTPSRSPFRDSNSNTSRDTRTNQQQRTSSSDRRYAPSQETKTLTNTPQTYNVQIPNEQLQILASQLSETLRLPPVVPNTDTKHTKN